VTETRAGGPDPRTYREAIGHFATGVTVVTTKDAQGPHGMTVNSLTSVSLDPTLLLVCLTRGSRTVEAIHGCGGFIVNVLSHEQIDTSNVFAGSTGERFAERRVDWSPEGLPVLPNSLATFSCRLWRIDDGGDHEIVIGEVIDCQTSSGDPLVFYRGRYARQIGFDDYPVASWWA
jgi:flavin reductase (DIM6/NTAB) family NADH-FMN oxidoreductase RutF